MSLIAPEDLVKLGVESQLIPFIVSTTSQVEQSPDGSLPLSPTEAENLVETLDRVVSSVTVNQSTKNRCIRVMRKVSPEHCVLPKSCFPPRVTLGNTIEIPYASGGFADVWEGQQDGNPVCIKAFRIQTVANPDKIRRRFYREIVGWKYISHSNVLPFLGVSDMLSSFCIISPWLSNGNIIKYSRNHHEADRIQLLAQAACGLGHLHSLSIVHSNVHPGNILITEEGNARIGDFGITAIITDPNVVERNNMTTSKPGLTRYMAPELLNPPQFGLTHSNPSKDSDVHSFAMTAYEVLSGALPYGGGEEGPMALNIVSGNRPSRPSNSAADQWLHDRIWDAIQRCWAATPQSRPPIDSLHQELAKMEQEKETPNEKDTPTTHTSNTVAPPPGLLSPERKNLAQNIRFPTKPSSERSESVRSPPTGHSQSESSQTQTKHEVAQQVKVKHPTVPPSSAGGPKRWKKWFCGLI